MHPGEFTSCSKVDGTELSQHIKLWRAIKTTKQHRQEETDLELLARCDLAPKVQFLSENLSGGQKRKLQLAIALAGGSNLLLLDEISSGLDPLSRRAIWKLITANRGRTTIILTTHCELNEIRSSTDLSVLDEADYLGDNVAILQAPGRLLALDNPVALKTRLGRGFSLAVDVAGPGDLSLLASLQRDVPSLRSRDVRGKQLFATGSGELSVIRKLVARVQSERASGHCNSGYQVNSATLEEVFLDLNAEKHDPISSESTLAVPIFEPVALVSTPMAEKDLEMSGDLSKDSPSQETGLVLTPGRKASPFLSPFVDAWTIFLKRFIVFRRSFLLPIVGVVVVICAAIIPLFFLNGRNQTCAFVSDERRLQNLVYPYSLYPFLFSPVVLAPSSLANAFSSISNASNYVDAVADNASFVEQFATNSSAISFGGLSRASNQASRCLRSRARTWRTRACRR